MSEISPENTVTEDDQPTEIAAAEIASKQEDTDNQQLSDQAEITSDNSDTDTKAETAPQACDDTQNSEAAEHVDEAESEPEIAADPDEHIELSDQQLSSVEAVLFTTDSPISPGKIAEVVQLEAGRQAAKSAIAQLNEKYETMGCAFRIEQRAGGYRMLTLPEHNEVLGRMLKVRSENRLTPTALETLAIIAYKQPVLRVDIEAIRGVSSGEMTRSLMEKGLVKIVGRAEEIGRPMLYGTTSKFLEVFGMNSLKDLPEVEAMAAIPRAPKPKPIAEEENTEIVETKDISQNADTENVPDSEISDQTNPQDAPSDTAENAHEDIEAIETAATEVAEAFNTKAQASETEQADQDAEAQTAQTEIGS